MAALDSSVALMRKRSSRTFLLRVARQADMVCAVLYVCVCVCVCLLIHVGGVMEEVCVCVCLLRVDEGGWVMMGGEGGARRGEMSVACRQNYLSAVMCVCW